MGAEWCIDTPEEQDAIQRDLDKTKKWEPCEIQQDRVQGPTPWIGVWRD